MEMADCTMHFLYLPCVRVESCMCTCTASIIVLSKCAIQHLSATAVLGVDVAENNADCAAKGVEKKDAGEQVGVVCLCDGKYGVVEYSEIPADLSAKTDDKGGLVLNMANIANHYYTLEFLEKVQKLEMPFHLAHKKIPYWTGSALVKPEKNNGVKLEQFIFDVFPYTSQFKVLAVERASEFSPLKNAKGPDSAETSRNDLMQLHKQYVEQAKGVCAGPVELSPLLTYEGEGLESLAGKTVSGHLE